MSGEVRGHATSLREELKGELTEGERLRKERSLLHHVEHLAVPETKKRAVDLFLFGVFVGLLIGSAVLRAKGVAGSVGVGFGVALGLNTLGVVVYELLAGLVLGRGFSPLGRPDSAPK